MAGVQANLIPVLDGARKLDDNPHSGSWQAIVCLNYAGIYVNVGATLSAVYVIQWAAELTTVARTLAMKSQHSMPALLRQGKSLDEKYLKGQFEMELLNHFGMPSSWKHLAHHMVWDFWSVQYFSFSLSLSSFSKLKEASSALL